MAGESWSIRYFFRRINRYRRSQIRSCQCQLCVGYLLVDVAGNVMFSPNTNGLKLSSSGQSDTRALAKIQAYNNTIINAGWRRDGEKGGGVYVEKNARPMCSIT